jgi:hypothetical protein
MLKANVKIMALCRVREVHVGYANELVGMLKKNDLPMLSRGNMHNVPHKLAAHEGGTAILAARGIKHP